MKFNLQGRGSANISLVTAIVFVAVIFIAGVYIGQEVKNFYRLRNFTKEAGGILTKANLVQREAHIQTFLDCLREGYALTEGNPPTCQTADGRVLSGPVLEVNGVNSLIKVNAPQPFAFISSPLEISGEAKGKWYFEGSFPVSLVDWDGRIIAEGFAQAQSDWMSEDFVKFKATLNFAKPAVYNNGALILKKDNPSGLPENDAALEIPVIFK